MYAAQDGCVGRDLVVRARGVDVAARAGGRSRDLGGGRGRLGEKEALKEVEVGWIWSAWEGRVLRLHGSLGGNGGEGED
ncbi:hypothetical protein TorRG33x02_251130 [Trema orientale]|uniref:Uncharacterized protein n=1 Tax=Trema orientale TaxID=63057 RepID=A0A2P5DHD2_TREOI|nr:hypothetical protein TorRG33x02_251130 [Trema orientale]